MRAGLVGIFIFVALLTLGHYVAAPFFCRGGISLQALDPRAFCGADLHLNRSGSMLLYFGAIAIAFLFGAIAGVLPGRSGAQKEEKPAADPAETFDQIIAAEEKKQQQAAPVAHPSPAAAEAAAPEASAAAITSPPPPPPAGPSASEAAKAAAMLSGVVPGAKANEVKKAEPALTPPPPPPPPAVATADAITVGLAAAKNGIRGTFDGTNEELLERFRELKKQEGVNSIAQAQRLLDESTMAALSKGIDPKQHLSDVAHLVLTEDPDLQSGVVRGVVVHIAARLKELGVANKLPTQAKGAA